MGLAGHDRRDGDALRRRPVAACAEGPTVPRCRATREAAWRALAQAITALENGKADAGAEGRAGRRGGRRTPVLGITGTGGAGKSSLTDELIRRLRLDQGDAARGRDQHRPVAAQERRRAAGRPHPHERHRALATGPARVHAQPGHARLRQRDQPGAARRGAACKAAGFDLIVVETSGIGQGDAAIVPLVDVPLYVMTPEFGAASQLEKIDMLDFAEFVAINKFDRKGAPTRCATWPSRCSATRRPSG
jgi:methylmalonyl-CoA mutase